MSNNGRVTFCLYVCCSMHWHSLTNYPIGLEHFIQIFALLFQQIPKKPRVKTFFRVYISLGLHDKAHISLRKNGFWCNLIFLLYKLIKAFLVVWAAAFSNNNSN